SSDTTKRLARIATISTRSKSRPAGVSVPKMISRSRAFMTHPRALPTLARDLEIDPDRHPGHVAAELLEPVRGGVVAVEEAPEVLVDRHEVEIVDLVPHEPIASGVELLLQSRAEP